MRKRAVKSKSNYIKGAAFSEIFILILATVAFAFVLGEANFVSAYPPVTPVASVPVRDGWITDLYPAASTPTGPNLALVAPEGGFALLEEGAGAKYSGLFGGEYAVGSAPAVWYSLLTGVVWAAGAYTLGTMIGNLVGLQGGQTRALSVGLAAGAFVYQTTQGVGLAQGLSGYFGGTTLAATQLAAAGIGLGIGIVVFAAVYKEEGRKTITVSCIPYEPKVGGADCEKCNGDIFRPCTEYRCKSLGQACQLLNKETPGEENCAWVNPKDVTSPKIIPNANDLEPKTDGLRYISDTSVRPPALGVKIVKGSDGCLAPFTPLAFGVNTDEPSQCKVDYNHTKKFEEMQYYLGGSNYYQYNHTQKMRLPGPNAFNVSSEVGEAPIFQNDGTSQLFVRCRDANGNENVDEYSIKFCVDPAPDTTPPLIEGTSIASESPVRFGTNNVSVETYVNEPAECKWSIDSKAYEDMENTMSCNPVPDIRNAIPTFVCTANITGIKNTGDSKYYFRCKDNPGKTDSERNVMVQSYEYTLRASKVLDIISVSPNETISGSTDRVSVDLELETSNGAQEGLAFCSFSPTGENDTYITMFETDSFKHKQTLQLVSGTYTYYFRCVDLGGNSADSVTTFSVFSDRTAPGVARVYREEGIGLKIVTDEDAECAYSLTSCNFAFEEGLPLIYSNLNIKTNSYIEWKSNQVYYIMCRDLYGNEPNPNECSVIVKPLESISK